MKKALFYKTDCDVVQCELCPHNCKIANNRSGRCRVRQNINGTLYTQNYAVCTSYALDPIEKKPLYHFYPGSTILSVGTWGCNFSCKFCQNWEIAHGSPDKEEFEPDKLAEAVVLQDESCIGVAYTYSEPSVWYEYILDAAAAVHSSKRKNVLVTNGFINEQPLKELAKYIDAANIDVKAFNNTFYQDICGGSLEHVKNSVELALSNYHVEITTLIVPGLNDDREEIKELAKWLSSLDKNVPLHFSRYFPRYQMKNPATPLSTLEMAYEVAHEYLNYVYVGNIAGERSNTNCPECGRLVIDRTRYINYLLEKNKCPECQSIIEIEGNILF